MDKKQDRDYWDAILALSSCAIEGNELAIKLLKLHDTDHDAFLREIRKMGFIGQKEVEIT